MFVWSEQSRAWYIDAARYSSYHREQAAVCASFLHGLSTVAEFGCGPGFLAMELAMLGFATTGFDIDAGCVAFARRESAQRHLANIVFEERDALALDAGASWDCVVCCHFGDLATDLDTLLSHTRNILLAFVRRPEEEPLVPGRERRCKQDASSVAESLRQRGAGFVRTDCDFEFGQPFASSGEARNFVRHYTKNALSDSEAEAFLAPRLVQTPSGFYLPHKKRLALFAIKP